MPPEWMLIWLGVSVLCLVCGLVLAHDYEEGGMWFAMMSLLSTATSAGTLMTWFVLQAIGKGEG